MTDVYRNLRRAGGCWSVREGGRVVAHVPEIALRDVRLVVQPGGRAACLRTGVRSVHAVARGSRTDFAGVPVKGGPISGRRGGVKPGHGLRTA